MCRPVRSPRTDPRPDAAIATALASLLTNTKVDPNLAMTGEITLTGQVLPIGGVKEKVLGAKRAGITKVLLPKRNEIDLEDVPKEVRDSMTFVPVEELSDVFAHALGKRIITPVSLGENERKNENKVVPMRRVAAKRITSEKRTAAKRSAATRARRAR